MKNQNRNIIGILIILVGIAVLSEFVFKRFDTTRDKRYTLSGSTVKMLREIKTPLKMDVLMGGKLPGNYRNLKNEIRFMLDEFQNINPKISYEFTDPKTIGNLDLQPVSVQTDNGTLNIYPYGLFSAGNKRDTANFVARVSSLPNTEWPSASIDKLEYSLLDAVRNVTRDKKKNIAFTVNHGELANHSIYLAGLLKELQKNYNVVAYNSDSTFTTKDLNDLKKFDALIVAKPTEPFTDEDKLVLDQYVMNGGKMLWMTEGVDAEMDSIYRSGRIVAFPRDLKLNDFFFNYGIRYVPAIVKDAQAASIMLADGEISGNVSYNSYTWPYFVIGTKGDASPITETIGPVRFEFANTFELLENQNVRQTVLLATYSDITALQPSMNFIELNEVGYLKNRVPEYMEEYSQFRARMPLAVLLEGDFVSAYASRFERNEFPAFKSQTKNGKMIVIADGDVGKNHLWRGKPMALGEDKYSVRWDAKEIHPAKYDNENFLLNCVDYLLGDVDFLNLKNRKLEIPALNETKVRLDKSTWQMTNLILPVVVIWIIGLGMVWWRKRRFA